jgi:hypothetical protein
MQVDPVTMELFTEGLFAANPGGNQPIYFSAERTGAKGELSPGGRRLVLLCWAGGGGVPDAMGMVEGIAVARKTELACCGCGKDGSASMLRLWQGWQCWHAAVVAKMAVLACCGCGAHALGSPEATP